MCRVSADGVWADHATRRVASDLLRGHGCRADGSVPERLFPSPSCTRCASRGSPSQARLPAAISSRPRRCSCGTRSWGSICTKDAAPSAISSSSTSRPGRISPMSRPSALVVVAALGARLRLSARPGDRRGAGRTRRGGLGCPRRRHLLHRVDLVARFLRSGRLSALARLRHELARPLSGEPQSQQRTRSSRSRTRVVKNASGTAVGPPPGRR